MRAYGLIKVADFWGKHEYCFEGKAHALDGCAQHRLTMSKHTAVVTAAKACMGVVLASFVLLVLSITSGQLILIAPFGATMTILFASPNAPLAQPRAVLGAYALTTGLSLVAINALPHGLNIAHLLHPSTNQIEVLPALWQVTLASILVGACIFLMLVTRWVHPPAGGIPVLLLTHSESAPPGMFLFYPVLTGALLLIAFAWGYHRWVTLSAYPIQPDSQPK